MILTIPNKGFVGITDDSISIGDYEKVKVSLETANESEINQLSSDIESTDSDIASLELEGNKELIKIGQFSKDPTSVFLLLQIFINMAIPLNIGIFNSILKSDFTTIDDAQKFAQPKLKPKTIIPLTPSNILKSIILGLTVTGLILGISDQVADLSTSIDDNGIKNSPNLSSSVNNKLNPTGTDTSPPTPVTDTSPPTPVTDTSPPTPVTDTSPFSDTASNVAGCSADECSTPVASSVSFDPDPDKKGGGLDPIVFGQWWYDENSADKCKSVHKFDYDSDGWFEDFCYIIRNNSTDPNSGIFLVNIPYTTLEEKFNVGNIDRVEYPSGWNMLAIDNLTLPRILQQIPELCEKYDCYIWNDEFNKNWKIEETELNPFIDSFDPDKIKMFYQAKEIIDEAGNKRYIYCQGETVNGVEFVCLKPTYWMKGI